MRRLLLLVFVSGCTYGPPPAMDPPVPPPLLGCEGSAPKPAHCPAASDACTNSVPAAGTPAVAFNCPGDGLTQTVVADIADTHLVFRNAMEWIGGNLRATGDLTDQQERFSTGGAEFRNLDAPLAPRPTPSAIPLGPPRPPAPPGGGRGTLGR